MTGRYLRIARNRQTGTVTTVIDNRDRWYSDDPEDWINECCEHSTLICHETRKLAEAFAAYPAEWCELCRMIYEARSVDPANDELPREPRARLAAMIARYEDPHGWNERALESARSDVSRMSDEEVHIRVGSSVLGLDRD